VFNLPGAVKYYYRKSAPASLSPPGGLPGYPAPAGAVFRGPRPGAWRQVNQIGGVHTQIMGLFTRRGHKIFVLRLTISAQSSPANQVSARIGPILAAGLRIIVDYFWSFTGRRKTSAHGHNNSPVKITWIRIITHQPG